MKSANNSISLSSITMLLFGSLAALLGIIGICLPKMLLRIIGLKPIPQEERQENDHTHLFVLTSSMASLNMGIYYILAAITNWKPFFAWTVPFRTLTFTVFSTAVILGRAPIQFIAIPLWEGVGALLTGIALKLETLQEDKA